MRTPYIFASTSSDQFFMRAEITLEITNGEQRAFRNFPPAGTFLRQVIWLTPSKQDNMLRFYHSQQLTANYALCYMPFDAKLLYLASQKSGR